MSNQHTVLHYRKEYEYDVQYLLHDDVSHTKMSRICMYESSVHVKCTQLCLLLTEYVTFPAWWRSWEGKMKRMDENIIISINMGT